MSENPYEPNNDDMQFEEDKTDEIIEGVTKRKIVLVKIMLRKQLNCTKVNLQKKRMKLNISVKDQCIFTTG